MKLIRGSDILALGDAMHSLEDLAEGGDRAHWKARALEAEAALSRAQPLIDAAVEYAEATEPYQDRLDIRMKAATKLMTACVAYAKEGT